MKEGEGITNAEFFFRLKEDIGIEPKCFSEEEMADLSPYFVPGTFSRYPGGSYYAWYLEAFNRLSYSRQMGMGLGAIPVGEILFYANNMGIEDKEEFLIVMQACDNVFLEHHNKKDDKE